ncbi:MAG TPA: peptidoglycan DD-metalloendopeptidase family protein [Bacteroidia bacterium]|jgi:septal ring factor EnvC (AmiA/AmiB activator)|nr:peptidoglycan DD-metalloendopeptidase family protein [Bacteroidia bacterium]
MRLFKQGNRFFSPFFICIFLFLTAVCFGQKHTKKELENRKKQLQKEIDYTNELLAETKKNKKLSLTQLVTLNKKISAREELIATINAEIQVLNRQIKQNNESIGNLQKDLAKLKAEYAKMIYYAYKNRDSYSRLMFIFASTDFEQAILRLKYLQQYSDYRHKQAELIVSTQTNLNSKIRELQVKKSDKGLLLGSQETEKKHLTVEKSEKEQVFTELQDQESKLKKDLEKKKRDAEKLQQAIQRVIERELEKAQAEAAKANANKPKTQRLVLTPESQQLSTSFANNKGKLPWPVMKGVISEHFGVHAHPLMKDVDINNNGVDITTNNGSLVRAVFEGEVKAVVNMPGAGQFVLIRHGEYFTIYSNLKDIYIKVGDKVKTKENIGSILFDDEDSKTVMHFEVWKGQVKLDPEDWLYKNN